MKLFDRNLFFVNHEFKSIKVGLWTATYNDNRKEFLVELDCAKCQAHFDTPVRVPSIYQPLAIHTRHCKRDEKIPQELVRRMQAYIRERKKKDPDWKEFTTWDDIEREGKPLDR